MFFTSDYIGVIGWGVGGGGEPRSGGVKHTSSSYTSAHRLPTLG